MSESQTKNIQANAAKILNTTTANNPETKPLDRDAPYKHEPAKPKDGDSWTTVLIPELQADTLRCNAWKDEVQNLLIFAGLFSAVVTTFLIESYKFLQPDPSITIAGLLFHIASGLNNTSSFPPSVSSESILVPFSQTPSVVRMNVFWFISLILSLTTVLIGTIALQWLREHQSYGGYSSKEKLAMLHMRTRAAEAWYLPQVFAVLPLLLQAALVLFLAGLIEFSLPLGPKLTIPISIVIGLTLLFLAATTILPTIQGLLFFSGLYPRKTVPTPCPFKSPQSQAFRALFRILLRVSVFRDRFFPLQKDIFNSNTGMLMIKNPFLLIPEHLALSVRNMWDQQTWLTIDRVWLSLRDASHQRIFDNDPDLYIHRARWEDAAAFPLSDVTQCLVQIAKQTPGSKHTESLLAALVHCFQEISGSIWAAPIKENSRQKFFPQQRKDRRNHYFERLLEEIPGKQSPKVHTSLTQPLKQQALKPVTPTPCSLSNFLLHGGDYRFDRFVKLKQHYFFELQIGPKIKQLPFSEDQTVAFLHMLLTKHTSSALAQYQLEVWSRVLYSSGHIASFTPIIIIGSSIPIPNIIQRYTIECMIDGFLGFEQQLSAVANILDTLFNSAASHRISQDRLADSLFAHLEMVDVFDLLTTWIREYLLWAKMDTPKQYGIRNLDDQFVKIFKFISDHLNENRTDLSASSQRYSLAIFYYLSSLFAWQLLRWSSAQDILRNRDSNFGKALGSLLDALHKTWSSGWRDERIEKQLQGSDNVLFGGRAQRFSTKWWTVLFKHIVGPAVGVQVNHIELAALEEKFTKTSPNVLSQLEIASGNIAGACSTTRAFYGLDQSPALNMHPQASDVYNALALVLPNPQAGNSKDKSTFDPADHVDKNTPRSPSNPFDTLNPSETTSEGPEVANNFTLSHSRPSSFGSPLGDNHTAAATASQIISLSKILPPLDSEDSASQVLQITPNRTGNRDRQDLQSDHRHLAIDIEPRAIPEDIKIPRSLTCDERYCSRTRRCYVMALLILVLALHFEFIIRVMSAFQMSMV